MSSPKWRGVNHLAFVTSNMDDTVRFYAGVLGARLVATVGTPSFRHYFFDFGTNSTLAFFEYPDVEPDSYAKPAGMPVPEASQFDHLSFDLVDEEALLDLRVPPEERELRGHRRRRSRLHPVDLLHGPERHRARGFLLGRSTPPATPRSRSTTRGCSATRTRCPPSPSSAPARLQRVPATKLVDGFTKQAEDWIVR